VVERKRNVACFFGCCLWFLVMEKSPLPDSSSLSRGDLLVSPSSVIVAGCRRVELFNCSRQRFELLVSALTERSVIPLLDADNQSVVSFQKLAWLQEWCRMNRELLCSHNNLYC
jgi:hypothetical protein